MLISVSRALHTIISYKYIVSSNFVQLVHNNYNQNDCQGGLILTCSSSAVLEPHLLLTALDGEKLLCLLAVISPHADLVCPSDLMTTAFCQSRLQPVICS